MRDRKLRDRRLRGRKLRDRRLKRRELREDHIVNKTKFDVIINPLAAGGRSVSVWKMAEPYFAACEYEVHYSTKDISVGMIAEKITSQGRPVNIVVVGGDGTVNEVLNGIKDFSNVGFGLLPGGSANDLAKALDIKAGPDLVKKILEGTVRRSIDLGELIFHNYSHLIDPQTYQEDPALVKGEIRRLFINSVGVGWDGDIIRASMTSKLKRPLNKLNMGQFIYAILAVLSIFTTKTFRCGIRTENGQLSYDKVLLCEVMNHRFAGGGFSFTPDARSNDGLLNLCAAYGISRKKILPLILVLRKEKHLETPYAEEKKAARFHCRTSYPVWVHYDGEIICKSSDLTVRLYKEKLNLLF